jgi:hypothetical protein
MSYMAINNIRLSVLNTKLGSESISLEDTSAFGVEIIHALIPLALEVVRKETAADDIT